MSTFKKYMEIIQEAEITSDIYMSENADSKLQKSFLDKVKKFYSDKQDNDKDKDWLIKNIAKNLSFLKQYEDYNEFQEEFEAALKQKLPKELPASAEKMFRSLAMLKKQSIISDKENMGNTFVEFNDRDLINNAEDYVNAKKILEGNAKKILKKNNQK